MTEPKRKLAGEGKWRQILGYWDFADLSQGSVLVKVSLDGQLDPSSEHLGLTEAFTNCGSLYSSKQIGHGQSQAASNISMQQRPAQEAPELIPQWSSSDSIEQDPTSFTSGISKGRSRQVPDPAEMNCASYVERPRNI